jgi:translation initiation factor 2A
MATFVSEAEAAAMSLPPTCILAQARRGLLEFIGPPSQTPAEGVGAISVPPGSTFDTQAAVSASGQRFKQAPLFSSNGRFVAFSYENAVPIVIADAFTGATVTEIDCTDAVTVEFSPQGTYLITWSRPKTGSEEGNQRVWRAESGEMVVSYTQKSYKKHSVQFTADERYFLRIVTNEVHIYNALTLGTADSNYTRLIHRGITSFAVSPTSDNMCVAVFVPAEKGNPAKITLYRSPVESTPQEEICTTSVFSASECSFYWNATGTTVLAHTHADVDSSGASYYGATRLLILSVHGTNAQVNQSKDGPIYDVSWSPIGDRFVIAAGNMPAHCTMYNDAGAPTYEFGAAHRNTVSWSPHGRFLCLAGFGNLPGAMDFYDTVKMKKIGSWN